MKIKLNGASSLRFERLIETLNNNIYNSSTFVTLLSSKDRYLLSNLKRPLSKDECNHTIRIYDREYFKRNPEQLTPENLGFVKFNHGQTHYAYKDENLEDITNFSREQQLEYSQMEVQKADE